METGPAGGEMRLSFKGSAGDALKLPITHLSHASAGLRTLDRRGEKESNRIERNDEKTTRVSALFLNVRY